MPTTETQLDVHESATQPQPSKPRRALTAANQMPESRLILAILLIATVLAVSSPAFLSRFNLVSVLMSFSFIAIAGLGELLVIVTGGIDLSVGSVIGLAGMLAAFAIEAGYHPAVGILIGILGGAIVGLVNGFFVVKFKIYSFIITLGTLQIARGITVGLTRGRPSRDSLRRSCLLAMTPYSYFRRLYGSC